MSLDGNEICYCAEAQPSLPPNPSISFKSENARSLVDSARVRAKFRIDPRRHGTYDCEGSREFSPVQSALCTRKDNNLLTRTCRLGKMGPATAGEQL